MRSSRTTILASAIAITALLVGAAAFFATGTNDAEKPAEATAPIATETLEPVVVVAAR